MWSDVFVCFWFCFLAMKWYRVASWEAISITIWNTCMTRSQKVINFYWVQPTIYFDCLNMRTSKYSVLYWHKCGLHVLERRSIHWFHNHTNSAVSKTKILTFHSCLLCDFIMSSHCYIFVLWSTKVSQEDKLLLLLIFFTCVMQIIMSVLLVCKIDQI